MAIHMPDTKTCDECGHVSFTGDLHQPWCWTLLQAKVAGIVEAGIARLEAKAKEHATRPPADVRDPSTGLPVVGSAQGLPLAPVRDVGAERGAECLRGYDLALAHSLKAAHHTIQEVAKKRDLSVADALEWVRQGLAEDWKRLWVESSVAVGRKE